MRKAQFAELFEGLTMLYGVETAPAGAGGQEWSNV